ncbi:MAG: response regulator [Anaerolineales bacterium]
MGAPRIIIVDSDHQVSNTLRSNLQLSGQTFTIVDAPSGEEALLELSRGGVDLMITDLVLPGISGLELLEKAKNESPDARAIIVTGSPSVEARDRAEELGVIAFLTKPIRTSHFLEAVSHALELKGKDGGHAAEEEREFIAQWLMAMQSELGAEATFLVDERGEVIVEAGEIDAVDLRMALPSLMSAFEAGVEISGVLQKKVPANFMYFDGESYDFYQASVGSDHALVIVFESKKGAKQIGAVLQYSRQAATDLVSGLYSVGEAKVTTSTSRSSDKKKKKDSERNGDIPSKEVKESDLESAASTVSKKGAEDYWDEANESSDGTGPIDESMLTFDEARKRGLLRKEKED